MKYNIEGLIVLTEDDVENMVVGALEGGSNYWYWLHTGSIHKVKKATPEMEGQPLVDRILTAIQLRGVTVTVLDVENRTEKLGVLTKESWAKAEQLMVKNHRRHFADIIGENDDATTADVFFQLAVLGDVVYG